MRNHQDISLPPHHHQSESLSWSSLLLSICAICSLFYIECVFYVLFCKGEKIKSTIQTKPIHRKAWFCIPWVPAPRQNHYLILLILLALLWFALWLIRKWKAKLRWERGFDKVKLKMMKKMMMNTRRNEAEAEWKKMEMIWSILISKVLIGMLWMIWRLNKEKESKLKNI